MHKRKIDIKDIDSYRLKSKEEPSDEILHQLMEEVAEAARESSRNARAELDRRMEEVRKSAKEKRIAREKGDH